MRMLDSKYLKFVFMRILLLGVVVHANEQVNSRTWDNSTIAAKQNLEGRMKRETDDGNDGFVVK